MSAIGYTLGLKEKLIENTLYQNNLYQVRFKQPYVGFGCVQCQFWIVFKNYVFDVTNSNDIKLKRNNLVKNPLASRNWKTNGCDVRILRWGVG